MSAGTQFDVRTYDAKHVVRFATPGYGVDEQRYYAVSGARRVVAYDLNRPLTACRATDDLGASPGAITFTGEAVVVRLSNGDVVRLGFVAPAPADKLGYKLEEEARHPRLAKEDWIASGEIDGTPVVFSPALHGGVATLDAVSLTTMMALNGVLPRIATAAYDPATERLYCLDGAGNLAVVRIYSTYMEVLTVVQVRTVMGLQVDARVLDNRLMICAFEYRRAYFIDIDVASATYLSLVEVRDFRTDPDLGKAPVTAMDYVTDPLVLMQPADGDSFMSFDNWPTTGARETGNDADAGRVYLHGGLGAVSAPPGEAAAKIVSPDLNARTAYNGLSELANGRYMIAFSGIAMNPAPFPGDNPAQWRNQYVMPGDPTVIYQIYARIRGVVEANAFKGSVPVTDPPASAGYSAQAAQQTRLLRNLRYRSMVWAKIPPFGSPAQDFHRIVVSDPHVEYWIAACEGTGTPSFGQGDDSSFPRGAGVPILSTPPANTTFTNGSTTVTGGGTNVEPTAAIGQDVLVDLGHIGGSLTCTNGSATYTVSAAITYTDIVGSELWIGGVYYGIVQSVASPSFTTDVAWNKPTVSGVTTEVWRLVVNAGPLAGTSGTNLVLTNPWPRATRGPARLWTIQRQPFAEHGDPRFGVPPHNSGVIVLDETFILNVRGQATIDTLLDFVEQATTQNTRKAVFTTGSNRIHFLDGADLPAQPPTQLLGKPGVAIKDGSNVLLGISLQWTTPDTFIDMDREWTGPNTTYTTGAWKTSTAGSLAAFDPAAMATVVNPSSLSGSITITNGSNIVQCTAVPPAAAAICNLEVTAGSVFIGEIVGLDPVYKTITLAAPVTLPTATYTAGQWQTRTRVNLNNYEMMPPDDDPAHPLVIPWAPRFPVIRGVTSLPGKNFIQIDILRSTIAQNV